MYKVRVERRKSYAMSNPFVGVCLDKCPEFERHEREIHLDLSIFEVVPGTEYNPIPRIDHFKAVKKYHRSAAGNEEPFPEDVRPPQILRETLNYLLDQVASKWTVGKAPQGLEMYNFVRDRCRSIRQDLTIQNCRDETSIWINETICRFHIVCGYFLSNVDGFDWHQNMEQTRKVLQTLMELYEDQESEARTSRHESEFKSYYMLVHFYDDEILRKCMKFSRNVFESRPVRLAFTCILLFRENNYRQLFQVLKISPNDIVDDYDSFPLVFSFQCCLLNQMLFRLRCNALVAFKQAYDTDVYLNELCNDLCFDDSEIARRFLDRMGIEVGRDEHVDLRGWGGCVDDKDPVPARWSVIDARFSDGSRIGEVCQDEFRSASLSQESGGLQESGNMICSPDETTKLNPLVLSMYSHALIQKTVHSMVRIFLERLALQNKVADSFIRNQVLVTVTTFLARLVRLKLMLQRWVFKWRTQRNERIYALKYLEKIDLDTMDFSRLNQLLIETQCFNSSPVHVISLPALEFDLEHDDLVSRILDQCDNQKMVVSLVGFRINDRGHYTRRFSHPQVEFYPTIRSYIRKKPSGNMEMCFIYMVEPGRRPEVESLAIKREALFVQIVQDSPDLGGSSRPFVAIQSAAQTRNRLKILDVARGINVSGQPVFLSTLMCTFLSHALDLVDRSPIRCWINSKTEIGFRDRSAEQTKLLELAVRISNFLVMRVGQILVLPREFDSRIYFMDGFGENDTLLEYASRHGTAIRQPSQTEFHTNWARIVGVFVHVFENQYKRMDQKVVYIDELSRWIADGKPIIETWIGVFCQELEMDRRGSQGLGKQDFDVRVELETSKQYQKTLERVLK